MAKTFEITTKTTVITETVETKVNTLEVGKTYWTNGNAMTDWRKPNLRNNVAVRLVDYIEGTGFLVADVDRGYWGTRSALRFVRTLWANEERTQLVASFGDNAIDRVIKVNQSTRTSAGGQLKFCLVILLVLSILQEYNITCKEGKLNEKIKIILIICHQCNDSLFL